ncbi:hypothetical protein AYI70_g7478 [Smittium culicis]|uniref:Uncharacterized protein n=1 Tax=Smittium culicis TaxID=133412 RepID=A0A1R1XKJ3_9FUNG|nr:hypothetical protein AYI70_g7478 [Smittium culicis]
MPIYATISLYLPTDTLHTPPIPRLIMLLYSRSNDRRMELVPEAQIQLLLVSTLSRTTFADSIIFSSGVLSFHSALIGCLKDDPGV